MKRGHVNDDSILFDYPDMSPPEPKKPKYEEFMNGIYILNEDGYPVLDMEGNPIFNWELIYPSIINIVEPFQPKCILKIPLLVKLESLYTHNGFKVVVPLPIQIS